MLSLRTAAGIDVHTFENRYRQRFDVLEALFVDYERHGLAQRTAGGWRLTPEGFLVSNAIISSLTDALTEEKQRRLEKAQRGDYRIV